ncbi:L-arabinonate dehydratase [Kangiella sp.]|uniref:L-arabinonate dehydratase n=1 Tax=Kangiella sp. TaxID=1920245 RepID=UPI003A91956A
MSKLETNRSQRWLGRDDFRTHNHRSRLMQMGYAPEDWEGKPIVAIVNNWSDFNPCHMHFKQRVEEVKRGVFQSGGFPLELPTISLGENLIKPSALLYRNLLAMEVEEMVRALPIDGIVLLGGCDKTTPAMLMGATSVDLPTIFLPAGPMLRGNHAGKSLGSGSDAFKYWDEKRAGLLSDENWDGIISGIARTPGTCMTMGTASTMTAIAEAIGMTLPGASSIPAVDAQHQRMAAQCGRRIVELIQQNIRPSDIFTRLSFLNGITVAMAMGCSTNAIIHLIAQSKRAGHPVTLDDFDRISRVVPVVANVRPNGESHYLMEDFYYAGGLCALMKQVSHLLNLDEKTVNGQSLGANIESAKVFNNDVIRPINNPIYSEGSLAVLKGNIAPDGCVIKPSAMSQKFLTHEGTVLVFDSYPEMKTALESDALNITPDHVIILRNAGPQGGPGMPEWGMIPIPNKLVKQGVRDMLRISDARMSGTSYGACVLHVSPESYIGGPLALVRNGDIIRLDVVNRRLDILVSDTELAHRKTQWVKRKPPYQRGYGWMYSQHIQQANEGCDFDYLESTFGETQGEPDIF